MTTKPDERDFTSENEETIATTTKPADKREEEKQNKDSKMDYELLTSEEISNY